MFLRGPMAKAKEIFFHILVWTSKNPEWTCITFVNGGEGKFWKNVRFGLPATEMRPTVQGRCSFPPSPCLQGPHPEDRGSMSSPCARAYLLRRNPALAAERGTFQLKYLCLGQRLHVAFYGARTKESTLSIPLRHRFSRMAARNKSKVLSFHLQETALWHEF